MSRLILFNGGIDGGIYVEKEAARPIQRLPPTVLAHLRGVSELLRSTRDMSAEAKLSKDLSKLITRVTNIAVERVESAVGPLDDNDSLIYLSADDGFICGSDGTPPRAIEWPASSTASMDDLIQRGLIGEDILEFLRLACSRDLDVAEILEDPTASAKKIGVGLSDLAATNLKQLAPSQLDKIHDPTSRDLVAFFHKVLDDGRYLANWTVEPVSVSKALGVELDIKVIDRILGTNAIVGRRGDVANLSIEQGIVVGIVAIVVLVAPKLERPQLETIMDRSGIRKF